LGKLGSPPRPVPGAAANCLDVLAVASGVDGAPASQRWRTARPVRLARRLRERNEPRRSRPRRAHLDARALGRAADARAGRGLRCAVNLTAADVPSFTATSRHEAET